MRINDKMKRKIHVEGFGYFKRVNFIPTELEGGRCVKCEAKLLGFCGKPPFRCPCNVDEQIKIDICYLRKKKLKKINESR